MSPGNPRRLWRAAVVLLALAALASCRQKMSYQPSYRPLEPSDFFADGMSARPRIAGTVARGELVTDPYLVTGKVNGQDADYFPFPVTQQTLDRGQERYNIYCSECHGRRGDGNGMIPSRGYRRPPSYHTDVLRAAKVSHFFDVMTNGFGSMPSYAVQVPVNDRWAIAAYIRTLQLSRQVPVQNLPPDVQARLNGGAK